MRNYASFAQRIYVWMIDFSALYIQVDLPGSPDVTNAGSQQASVSSCREPSGGRRWLPKILPCAWRPRQSSYWDKEPCNCLSLENESSFGLSLPCRYSESSLSTSIPSACHSYIPACPPLRSLCISSLACLFSLAAPFSASSSQLAQNLPSFSPPALSPNRRAIPLMY